MLEFIIAQVICGIVCYFIFFPVMKHNDKTEEVENNA